MRNARQQPPLPLKLPQPKSPATSGVGAGREAGQSHRAHIGRDAHFVVAAIITKHGTRGWYEARSYALLTVLAVVNPSLPPPRPHAHTNTYQCPHYGNESYPRNGKGGHYEKGGWDTLTGGDGNEKGEGKVHQRWEDVRVCGWLSQTKGKRDRRGRALARVVAR